MPERITSTFASRLRRPAFDFDEPAVERTGRLRRLWPVMPVAVAFALFGAVVWLSYQDLGLDPPVGEPPLIKAAPDPVKLRPEETEDTTLAAEQGTVGRLWSDAEPADQPERLLPTPEAPLSPPAIEAPATAEVTVEQSAADDGGAPATPAEDGGAEIAADSRGPEVAETRAPEAAGRQSYAARSGSWNRMVWNI